MWSFINSFILFFSGKKILLFASSATMAYHQNQKDLLLHATWLIEYDTPKPIIKLVVFQFSQSQVSHLFCGCKLSTLFYLGFSFREALQNNHILRWNPSKMNCINIRCNLALKENVLPIDTVTLSCRLRTIIKDMAKMSTASITKNFYARHKNYWQIFLWLHILSYRLIIWWPSSSTIKFSRRSGVEDDGC